MAKKKLVPTFHYVVAYPWHEDEPQNLCIYAYGREVQYGTLEDAQRFLEHVKRRSKDENEPQNIIDSYGVYTVAYTKIA